MPNTAEYKNYLFVKVPEDATEFMISCAQSDNDLLHKNENGYNYIASFGTTMNQYQIIGKGDGLSFRQCEAIVERAGILNDCFRDYIRAGVIFILPDESFHSLLRSLDMEPGTTLVLKKNEK